MQDCTKFTKKRSDLDRRERKIPRIKYFLFGKKRKRIRRSEDQQRMIILDNYSPTLLAFVLIILALSLVDGFFKLHLTNDGAEELNPVMAYFLDLSPWAFMSVKYLLTSLSVICFLILNNLYIKSLNIRVERLFPAIIAVFLVVVFWQFFHTIK